MQPCPHYTPINTFQSSSFTTLTMTFDLSQGRPGGTIGERIHEILTADERHLLTFEDSSLFCLYRIALFLVFHSKFQTPMKQ